MTLKSHILGGAAVIALACAGFVAPSIAQQTAPATDQAAPAAPAASDDAAPTKAPAHHMHHNRWKHARGHSSPEERAETARLNQQQLAKAQGGSQGQYGGAAPSDTSNPPPAPAPSDQSNAPQPNDDGKMAPMNNTPPPPPPPDSTPKPQ
jgi:hypothetical protein